MQNYQGVSYEYKQTNINVPLAFTKSFKESKKQSIPR